MAARVHPGSQSDGSFRRFGVPCRAIADSPRTAEFAVRGGLQLATWLHRHRKQPVADVEHRQRIEPKFQTPSAQHEAGSRPGSGPRPRPAPVDLK